MAGVPDALALEPLAQHLARILSGEATISQGAITVTLDRAVGPRGGPLQVAVTFQPADPARLQAHCLAVGEAVAAPGEADAFSSALHLQGIHAVPQPAAPGGSSLMRVKWRQIEPAAVHAQKVARAATGIVEPQVQARQGPVTATSP